MVSQARHKITHALHQAEEWIFANPKIVLSMIMGVTFLFALALPNLRFVGTATIGTDHIAVEALRAAGTANQTRLVGRPVQGPVFEFAPAIAEYLQSHLFGAIFERDNLDWQSRELATVGMLSALPGAEAQLQSHMAVSLNVGLTARQMQQAVQVLDEQADNGRRAREALAKVLAAQPR